MELTRKEIEKLASGDMTYNELRDKHTTISCIPIRKIAQMLLAEMDKPKVWNGAPEYAGMAMVTFAKSAKESATIWSKFYTRELPKSRAREIADEAATENGNYSKEVADKIEAAILRDREERKQA